jgi:hypothetical protein
METKIDVKIVGVGNQFKIYLNGLIHFTLIQEEFVGFQSWVKGTDWYCIAFYTQNCGAIMCDYTSKELWESILKELDKFKF